MKVFTAHENCTLAVFVLCYLRSEDPEVDIVQLEGDRPAEFGSVVVCTSKGDFPEDCFIREIQPGDKERYGISAPDFARYANTVFALNSARHRDILMHHPQFLAELREMNNF